MNTPRLSPENSAKSAPRRGATSAVFNSRTVQFAAALLAITAAAACGDDDHKDREEHKEKKPAASCKPSVSDVAPEAMKNTRPTVAPKENSLDSNGTNYRLGFTLPDFDGATLPDFADTCQKWPLTVGIMVTLTRTDTQTGAVTQDAPALLGQKLVFQPGDDSVDFVLPTDPFTNVTATSYTLVVFGPSTATTDGGVSQDLVYETPTIPLETYAPGGQGQTE